MLRTKHILAATLGLAGAALLAGAAGADTIYVPLGDANRIITVDTATDTVTGTLSGVANVHGLAGTPDGRLLIAGSLDERPAGGAPPEKPAGMSADEHAAHHAPRPAAAAKAGAMISTVTVLRAADRQVVRRIEVPGGVHHVAVSPDSRYAVVTHPNADSVSVIDLEKFSVVATVATGPSPNFAAFAPKGDRLYVSNAGNETVSEVDTARWYVRRNFPVGAAPEHLVLSADGQTVFVNNVQDGTVFAIEAASGKTRSVAALGMPLHGIDLSDDQRTLFVSVLGEDRIVAIDLLSRIQRSVTLAPQPYHLAFVRGGGKIYVSSAKAPKIWVIDPDTLKVTGEIAIGGKGHQMVQAPAS